MALSPTPLPKLKEWVVPENIKYPYPSHGRSLEIQGGGGGGVSTAKICEGNHEANQIGNSCWEGGFKQKIFHTVLEKLFQNLLILLVANLEPRYMYPSARWNLGDLVKANLSVGMHSSSNTQNIALHAHMDCRNSVIWHYINAHSN